MAACDTLLTPSDAVRRRIQHASEDDYKALVLAYLCGIFQGGVAGGTVQRTPVAVLVTTSGTVAAGAKKVTFLLSPDYTGNILGIAFTGAADYAVPLEAPTKDTLGPIAYTVTTGSLRIIKIP